MDPQPPPLDGWPPSLPPQVFGTPPPPPPWPPTTPPETSSQTHALRWIAGAGTLLAVAGVLIVALVGWHPPGSAANSVAKQTTSPTTSATAPTLATAPSTAIPSVAPVSAAVAEAGRQYLAVVGPVNADGDQLIAALVADEALPCTCSPGEFEIRADALAVIPLINRDTEAMQVVLQMIKHEVPAAAADIDAVVVDNQEYMEDLGDAHNASQIKNGAVGLYMNDAEAVYDASRPDFARIPRRPRTAAATHGIAAALGLRADPCIYEVATDQYFVTDVRTQRVPRSPVVRTDSRPRAVLLPVVLAMSSVGASGQTVAVALASTCG